jgi:hypothetical protein
MWTIVVKIKTFMRSILTYAETWSKERNSEQRWLLGTILVPILLAIFPQVLSWLSPSPNSSQLPQKSDYLVEEVKAEQETSQPKPAQFIKLSPKTIPQKKDSSVTLKPETPSMQPMEPSPVTVNLSSEPELDETMLLEANQANIANKGEITSQKESENTSQDEFHSEDRLTALVNAANAWQQRPEAKAPDLLLAYHAITSLDKAHFQDLHSRAWETLSKAEVILCGSRCGLTSENKNSVPIFVFPSVEVRLNQNVADALSDEFRKGGFLVVTDRNAAAMLAEVSILGSPEPQADYSGQQVMMIATARLKLNMIWTADDSKFYSDQVQESKQGSQEDDLRNYALLSAITTLRQHLQSRLENK